MAANHAAIGRRPIGDELQRRCQDAEVLRDRVAEGEDAEDQGVDVHLSRGIRLT
jgi:hypothetical protein